MMTDTVTRTRWLEGSRRSWATLLALIVAVAAMRAAVIDRPFRANPEGYGSLVPLMARNYLRYPPAETKFAAILNTGLVAKENRVIYAHHPPLIPLEIAGLFALFGESEWACRLVPSLCTIGSAALIFVLVHRGFGRRAAALAAIAYAFCPMTIAFGGSPDFVNVHGVFFGLATVAAYFKWNDTGRRRWYALACLVFAAGAAHGWMTFLVAPPLAAHLFATRGYEGAWRIGWPFMVVALLAFLGAAFWMNANSHDTSLLSQLRFRSAATTADESGNAIPLRRWIRWTIFGHQGTYHTWPLLALAVAYVAAIGVAAGGALLGRRAADTTPRESASAHAPALVLVGWAGLHLLLGAQGCYIHPPWSVLLTPGIAAAAGVALHFALRPAGDLRATAIGATLVICFIGGSILVDRRTYWEEFHNAQYMGYTLKELGTAIRKVAAPEEGVLTSDTNDWQAMSAAIPLWYYADRQLRPAITTPQALDTHLGSGPYPLIMGYQQPTGPRPRWFVLPRAHIKLLKPLKAALDARYPRQGEGKFLVYRLY